MDDIFEQITIMGGDGLYVEPSKYLFMGKKLGWVKTRPARGSRNSSGDIGRGRVLTLYRMQSGKYVLEIEHCSDWQGESNWTIIQKNLSLDEVLKEVGTDELAQDLYIKSGLHLHYDSPTNARLVA